MEDMEHFAHTTSTILCCMCGIPMAPNAANMCVKCLRTRVDITEGIPKHLTLAFCRGCGRYLNPPASWMFAELESRDLLTICLKKLKGLSKVNVVDAGWIWTEPHSKRLKIKVTVQKEVFTSTILQQAFIVEFVVQGLQCPDCAASYTEHTWTATVQARQRVSHKRTFYYLEQVILKHNAHLQTLSIQDQPDGIDFFFTHKSHGAKMIDFLQAVVPLRYKQSDKLISHDDKSNKYKYEYTYSVEIVPICKFDLMCLPRRLAASCGNIAPLVICNRVTTVLQLMDPVTLQGLDLTAEMFFRDPFRPLMSSKQLITYVVLDITPLGPVNGKYVLAEAQVVRDSDFGVNDNMFYTRTHLGHILNPGDIAQGYDLGSAVLNEADIAAMKGRDLPEVVLVKKIYGKYRGERYWKLKSLAKEEQEGLRRADLESQARDYERFLEDLEEDPESRKYINMYKADNAEKLRDTRLSAADAEGIDTPAIPKIEELLDDFEELSIQDTEMAEEEDESM